MVVVRSREDIERERERGNFDFGNFMFAVETFLNSHRGCNVCVSMI